MNKVSTWDGFGYVSALACPLVTGENVIIGVGGQGNTQNMLGMVLVHMACVCVW